MRPRALFAVADDELLVLGLKRYGVKTRDIASISFADKRFLDSYDVFKAKLVLNLMLVGDMLVEDSYLLDNPYFQYMMHDSALPLAHLLEKGWIVAATRHDKPIDERAAIIVDTARRLNSPSFLHCPVEEVARQGRELSEVPYRLIRVDERRLLEGIHEHVAAIERNLADPSSYSYLLNAQSARTSPRFVRALLREYRQLGLVSRSWLYDRLMRSRLSNSSLDQRHWLYHLVDAIYHGSLAECLTTGLSHPMPIPKLYDECKIGQASLNSLMLSPDMEPGELSSLAEPLYIEWPEHSTPLMTPAVLSRLSVETIQYLRESTPIKKWQAFCTQLRSTESPGDPEQFRGELEERLSQLTYGLYPLLQSASGASPHEADFARIEKDFGRLMTVLNVSRYQRTIAFGIDIAPAAAGGVAGTMISGVPLNVALGLGGVLLSHAVLNPLQRLTIDKLIEKRKSRLGISELRAVRVRSARSREVKQ